MVLPSIYIAASVIPVFVRLFLPDADLLQVLLGFDIFRHEGYCAIGKGSDVPNLSAIG